ncbi:MAG: thioredoxin family protein [Sphingomonas sp.]|uniref:protein-disulfide reductase DsbD family protein n=1 Tax=Sphingomonas sp. TaxID=28214 RepID=UPI0025EF9C57|nr:protein-disulfide reductase DsbD domain-containing protein [Sphingomonas sp.]MBX3563830.1 thioredoxin family protein [Sphingomonas sp.]
MKAWCFMLVSIAAALLAPPAAAQPVGPGPHVQIELVTETAHPAPGGEVTLAFASVPDKGWHAYWENPGDAGFPASAKWTLPKGVTAGPIRFPVPQRLTIAGLMNYVYEGPFAQLVTLKLPADARGELPIAVELDYLVCTDAICVPEKRKLSTLLTVGDGAIPADRRARFDGWRKALPKPLGSSGTYQLEGGRVRLAIPYPASAPGGDFYFYPLAQNMLDHAAPQTVTRDGDRLVIDTAAKGAPTALEGVLAIGGQGFIVSAKPGAVPPIDTAFPWAAALAAFFGAVLGGLLLNVMPCVFPILSLKALSLAKANDGAGHPRSEALAYTAGVVLVCLALGGTLLALRAGGATLGWAFQLQDPRVILILLLLVTGIALNLAGLFELSAPGIVNRAASKGTGGAFATGALAAFVATPCTGPFMGAALGAALILPWLAALAVFAGLGLGIALPFLALGFIPALRRHLPKPGAWMENLRRILSIPMFLTALALAWVLGRQTGVDGMAMGLLVTLGLALVLWALGRRQARGLGSGLAWPMVLLIAIAGIWLAARQPAEVNAAASGYGEPFSETRLAQLRAEGRPVFAYFTADWCLTCKVNEKAVIETATVQSALQQARVAVLVGDWTDGNPELGRFIERHNRAGVPLYLWYKPGAAEPEVLPQLLAASIFTERTR